MTSDHKRRQKKLARKAAKRKTKLADSRQGVAGRRLEPIRTASYEISDEPMPGPAYERLPEPVKDQLENLYHEVLTRKPKKALSILEPLIEQHPDVPSLYNYLYVAYQGLGDRTNAQRVLQEMLERFPDYLFARITHANDCLQRGEAEKVPEIFEGKYDLKLLYPERERFHLSEVLSFCAVMAWYFHTQGNHRRAETYYEMMRQLDPTHRSTRFIKRLLHPSWLRRWLRRLLSRES
jgi:tetratricopeptide (TPR) repeat protein